VVALSAVQLCLGKVGNPLNFGADPCCHGNEIWPRRGDLVAYRLVSFLSYLQWQNCNVLLWECDSVGKTLGGQMEKNGGLVEINSGGSAVRPKERTGYYYKIKGRKLGLIKWASLNHTVMREYTLY